MKDIFFRECAFVDNGTAECSSFFSRSAFGFQSRDGELQGSVTTNPTPPTPAVPLPASGLLVLGALGGLAAMKRRRKA